MTKLANPTPLSFLPPVAPTKQHASCSNRLTNTLQSLVQDVGELSTVVTVNQSTDATLQTLPLLQAPPALLDSGDRRALATGLDKSVFDSTAPPSEAETSGISAYSKASGELGTPPTLSSLIFRP